MMAIIWNAGGKNKAAPSFPHIISEVFPFGVNIHD
jgi:hypothetical protein